MLRQNMNQRHSFFLLASKLSGGNGVRWIRELTMTRRAGQINCIVSNLHDRISRCSVEPRE